MKAGVQDLIQVNDTVQAKTAAKAAEHLARELGFSDQEAHEIALATGELATNLVKHAKGGEIRLSPMQSGGITGVQIVSEDDGPGIPDVEAALGDGYSTSDSLGYGLGTVNRLMDGLEFCSRKKRGLRIMCQRWKRSQPSTLADQRLEFGAATRSYRLMPDNGDAIVLCHWEGHALAGVIDGLGHGNLAHRAAQAARQYVEQHFEQPLDRIFQGTSRACRSTRGVVMGLARFQLASQTVVVAGLGNVEIRLIGCAVPFSPRLRRGVVGIGTAQLPVPTEHPWTRGCLLIMHSDGVRPHWTGEEIQALSDGNASIIARHLLDKHGRLEDDATAVVARNLVK
jgi:anti-sigma regulatory factor (Ser/Thr protein kinase)